MWHTKTDRNNDTKIIVMQTLKPSIKERHTFEQILKFFLRIQQNRRKNDNRNKNLFFYI